jgi:toxin ParE1/3/4
MLLSGTRADDQGSGSSSSKRLMQRSTHIARWPQAAQRVPGVSADIPARKAPVKGFPYHIAYLEMPDTIRVLAFAHDSREPGYWHSRMSK